jgi:hypothetical protein
MIILGPTYCLATVKLSVFFYLMRLHCIFFPLSPSPLSPLASRRVSEILTLSFSLYLSLHVIVARYGHTSVLLSGGSVMVMGGYVGSYKKDVWKSVDDGASWILVTSSAGWTGKELNHLSNSLPILPS